MDDAYPTVYKSKGKWIVEGETYLESGVLRGKLSSKFKIADAVVSDFNTVYLCEDGKVIVDNIISRVHNGFKIKKSLDNKVVCVLYGDGDLATVRYSINAPAYKFKNIYMYSTYIYGIIYGDYFISRDKHNGSYSYTLYNKATGEITDDTLPLISELDWKSSTYAYTYIGILTDNSVKSWATFGKGFVFPEYLENKKIVKIINKADYPAYYILDNGKAVRHDSDIPDINVNLQGKIIEIVDEYVLTSDKELYTVYGDVVLSYIQGEVEVLYSNKIIKLKDGIHIQL